MQIIRALLFPLAVIYDGITRLRNYLYNRGILKSVSYPLPVICVGNLSVGGTGKSPMIAYLVELLEADYTVAVLSRGYGRKTRGYLEVETTSVSREVGDEPLQLKKNFPKIKVVVCEDRRTALEKLKFKVDVVLMDDGFQHRKVKPTFTILLTAFNALYSNDFLLPTGNLRESHIGADRADIIIVTKCPTKTPYATLQKIQYDLDLLKNQRLYFSKIGYGSNIIGVSETLSINYLKQKKFTLVTGIAKPEPLVTFLKDKGLHFTHKKFGDHHEFTSTEIAALSKEELIITTEKDFVRLQPKLGKFAIYYLPIKTQFLNSKAVFFDQRVREVIEGFKETN